MYRVADYVWMLADDQRTRAYATAIGKTVKPGDRVLEIGSGIGFFSIVAAQAGAAQVVAAELTPAAQLGPQLAAANGCADRVVFNAIDSRRLSLDQPVDVIIADLRGPLPFCGSSLETLIDARVRLLRPGGAMIAERDRLFAAPCSMPEVWHREVAVGLRRSEVRLDPIVPHLRDTPFRCRIEPEALLADGAQWLELDYRAVDRTDHTGTTEWVFDRDAVVDGLALWFDSDIGGGQQLSSAPAVGGTVYRQLYLPFREPVRVVRQARLRAEVGVRLVRGQYIWSWRVWLQRPGETAEHLTVSQNSLAELLIDSSALAPIDDEARPRLNGPAHALAQLAAEADGQTTIAELGDRLHRSFPSEFPSRERARAFAARWIARLNDPAFMRSEQ